MKIQEADKINIDLKTDDGEFGIQRSKNLAENTELNKQLDIAGKVEAELNQSLEDMKTENEEKKITDDKVVIEEEFQAATDEVSVLKQQLKHAEQPISHNLEVTVEENESLKAKLDKRENEVSNLSDMQKLELYDRIAELEKISAERESELSVLQDKLKKAEEEGSAQMSACNEHIENLKHDLFSMLNQILGLDQMSKDLNLKLESAHSEKKEVEEQLRAKERVIDNLKLSRNKEKEYIKSSVNEMSKLRLENLELYDKIDELERLSAAREFEISRLHDKLYKEWEEEALGKINVFQAKVDNLQKDLLSMQKTKEEFELSYKKSRKEHAKTIKIVAKLERQVEDLKRDVEEKGDEITTLLDNVRNLEVKLRLSNQNLQVTKQLLSDKEKGFRKAENQRALKDRIATLSAQVTAYNKAFHETSTNVKVCVNSVISEIDTVSLKFSEDCKNHENRFSNISHELQAAIECVREMNREKGQLKEEELILREKVEKLEATVVQLKKTVEELEKMVKEKEEGILDLGEEKREAIRQLCVWNDYHRERCDYLKDIISKTLRGQRGS
ncbi:uncharacterized protein [Cicer arietinum]|uniref:COP1-interactive protein 1-like n=1 Tax=Cicer arietinum TaxID=3827 RepID=A0A3Q7Y2A3_CICAR|nr:COP1-interactive protein 1-like [Cicer arietinum]XP_027191817.1 COP1-interactive protein 1-like [Cicer arietinum]